MLTKTGSIGVVMDQRDDERQFEAEKYRDYLRLWSRLWMPQKLRKKMDASDLVQDAMLKAVHKAEDFRGSTNGQYKAWLRMILKNTLLDAVKKHRLPEESIKETEDSSRRTEKWLAANEPSPDSHVAREELFELLSKFLSELPEDGQEVLVLHYIRGWKVSQIADELGRTRASVAGLVRRGLDQLRKEPRLSEFFGKG